MRFNITARHFKLSEELKAFTQEEASRLAKYYDGILDIEVILGWEKKNRTAEIKIAVYGTVLTATESSEDMHASVRAAVDKMERQLIKYKDKLRGFEHEKAAAPDAGAKG
ncbi:ribosome-associated translation inhibitor RaiA [bacterium]|nr:ribosome-associated translation inhibitor RaiA [bacterium]